jgi:hypothetical protein
MDSNKKQKMSIYFPPELLKQVRQSANANHRSFNQEVLFILQKELNYRKVSIIAEEVHRQQELAILTELVEASPEEFLELRKRYTFLDKRIDQEELRKYLEMLKGSGHSPQE